jgi:hypothetical protein
MPLFEKLRVSLARAFDAPLLSEAGDPNEPLSRTEYLRRAFGEPRKFLRRQDIMTFHPIDAPEGYAAGFFAREQHIPLRHEDLSLYLAENYEPALFVISLDQAQIIWMEDKQNVGGPKQILESFFIHLLRKTPLKDWSAHVRYFERTDDYWDVVRRCRQEITKVIFRFVPPNAFEGEELAQEFYTELQKEAQNEVLEQTIKGKPGKMNLEGPIMRASAEIAEQGAGERELRGPGNKLLYKSSEGRVTDRVPEDDMPTVQSPNFVRRVIDRLFGR